MIGSQVRMVIAGAVLLLSAAPARAQVNRDKVDPRMRPLLDPAVVAEIDQAPSLEALRNIQGLPLLEPLALSRRPGPAPTMIPVFVSLTSPTPAILTAAGAEIRATMGALFAARIPIAALATLAADPGVRYIQAAGRAKLTNDLAMADIKADQVRTRSGDTFTGATGAGVIAGFVDSGIDWAHGDFKHPDGTTRILYIWDQTTSGTPPGDVGGQTFSTGNECNAAQIDAASCTEHDTYGHGSHVAGSAAGDGSATGNGQPAYQYAGVAPNADIIMVKTTFNLDDVVAGIEYIFKRAELLGKPAVVNLSLGTRYSSHDGTDPWEQAIDSLTGPGHLVVASAGNEGSNQNATGTQAAPLLRHGTRTLTSVGDTAQLTFTVPSYTPLSGNYNDYALFTMWYDFRDRLTITVRRPDGTTLTANSGDPATASSGSGGYIYLDASTIQSAQNGDAQVELEVFDETDTQPPAVGAWRITVQLTQLGGSGRFDIWQYDESGTLAGVAFTGGGDNGYNVGAPGNAEGVVTVGAYTTRTSWNSLGGSGVAFTIQSALGDLATFSSSGPTRPGSMQASRQKPDLTAPGIAIISTLSANTTPTPDPHLVATDGVHTVNAGTSMSAPMVTGATALLLERNTSLTPETVKSILTSTARQDAYTTVSWSGMGGGAPNPSWGYGKLDVQAALAATTTDLFANAGPVNDALGGAFVLPRADIPSLQLRAQGSATETVRITGLRLRSSGTGNDATGVDEVRVYADADSNGTVEVGETLIGSGTLTADEGEVVLTGLDFTIPSGTTAYLLGTYTLNGTPTQGQTFQLVLESPANITAERVSDMQAVSFGGTAVAGSAVQAQEIGTLTVSIAAQPAPFLPLGTRDIVLVNFHASVDDKEGFLLNRLVGSFSGAADPSATISNVRLVHDQNGNGAVDANDVEQRLLAATVTGTTIATNPESGSALAAIQSPRNWLIVADVQASAVVGTQLAFRIDSLIGTGNVTDSVMPVLGLPLAGPLMDVGQTSVTLGGLPQDTMTVRRDTAALPLLRARLEVSGEGVALDSAYFSMAGTAALDALTNLRLVADRDSDGVQDATDSVIVASLSVQPNRWVRAVPNSSYTIPQGSHWLALFGDGAAKARFGQTFSFALDSADLHLTGAVSRSAPAKLGASAIDGTAYSIGGEVTLTVGAGPHPPGERVTIGTLPVLQFTVGASTLEDARIDSVSVTAQNRTGLLSALVQRISLYRDSAGAGTVPSSAALASIDNPFAGGSTAVLSNFALPLAAGAQTTLLVVAEVSDRLRQGDSLGFSLAGMQGTGTASDHAADVVMPTAPSSALSRATLLQEGEAFLISENPVRSGRVIFTYASPPTSMALYNFAGVRVRNFTQLPPDRFEWDVRGESPGLPNGMYILVVTVDGQVLKQRLMILSEAR